MNIRKTAKKGITWTTIGSIGRSLFQLLQIAILTRFLSKDAFGLVAMAIFVVNFSNIFVDMGISSAILHQRNSSQNEYSSLYWLSIFISLIIYIILLIITPFAAYFYKQNELNTIIPILGLNLIIMAAGRQHRTLMQKQFKFKEIAIAELISYFLGLISAVIFAINQIGVYSLIYSTLISSFIANGLFLSNNIKNSPIKFHFRINETKPFVRIGGFAMGSAILDFFSREFDILIIGKLLGAEDLGGYNLAKQIVMKIFTIITPIVMGVLNPLMASIQGEKEKLKNMYLKIVRLLAQINAPIYLLLIILSKEILYYLYGQQYVSSYKVLSLLAVAFFLTTLSSPVGSLQIATGRTDIGFIWTILRVVVTPIIVFLGALSKNIDIVALAYVIVSLLLVIPIWHIQLKPMANIGLKEYIHQFYKPSLFFIFMIVFLFINKNIFQLGSISFSKAAIKLLSLLIVYGLYIICFERESVKEIFMLFKS